MSIAAPEVSQAEFVRRFQAANFLIEKKRVLDELGQAFPTSPEFETLQKEYDLLYEQAYISRKRDGNTD